VPISCCGFLSPFGHRHSLPRSSDPRWGVGPSLRSADRPRRRGRTPSGFPRSTRTRCDRGGCLLYPGGGGAHPIDKKSPTGACRFSTASPFTPLLHPIERGSRITRHRRRFTQFTRPVCPLPVTPGRNGSPSAFPRCFAPRRHRRRTPRVGPGHRARAWNYTAGIGRTSDLRVRSLRATSCRTFFLQSMLTTGWRAARRSVTRSLM